MPDSKLISISDLPCCPEVAPEPCCERMQFSYRLEMRQTDVPVEVLIVAEMERCPGPLSLGDVVYSTTLLPGEKVRLFTSTRNTSFSFDSETKVNYRHEKASEETLYMSSMDRYMSDLTVRDEGDSSSSSHSDFEVNGSADYWTLGLAGGASTRVTGDFNGRSTSEFSRELSRHASASHDRTVQATRAANSISVGEVQSRTHMEGESEDTFEASTRTFENKNACHAVTYFAYQLVKKQTLKFTIKAVLRRVVDRAADTRADARPLRASTSLSVIPAGVLATSAKRLELETSGRTSAVAQQAGLVGGIAGLGNIGSASIRATLLRTQGPTIRVAPVSEEARTAALRAADQDLVRAGVIERVGGDVSPKFVAELGFERTFCLPTQAVVVKGCLDQCNVCEPSRRQAIDLDIKHKELKNKLLEKQIELLEKSQEYRCCPCPETEEEPT
jgi:hypothetical protein